MSELSYVQHYRCGLHSGIPKCCNKFFVRVWRHVWGTPIADLYLPRDSPKRWGYVPCPDCHTKGPPDKPIELKKCQCDFTNTMQVSDDYTRALFKGIFGITNEQMDTWAKRQRLPRRGFQEELLKCWSELRMIHQKYKRVSP